MGIQWYDIALLTYGIVGAVVTISADEESTKKRALMFWLWPFYLRRL